MAWSRPTRADSRSIVHELVDAAGEIYRDDNVTVTAFAGRHGTWPAFGFRFSTPDRTIVVSGDTAPFDELVRSLRRL